MINFEPSVEAVQEFRLVMGTPAAEYGSTMGSAVTLVTRSGGERHRGSLYEFFRNDWLDANNPFNKAAGCGAASCGRTSLAVRWAGRFMGSRTYSL
ncbi:MAG: hypothetical protein IPJ98_12815 [Bryobacterales bacterium]|nr:hypothetical protein [Bryobacterales bacterium]